MTVHSKYGGSGFAVYSQCPGSIGICKKVGNTDTEASKLGTLAHEYAYACQTEDFPTPHPDLDESYLDAVEEYLDYIDLLSFDSGLVMCEEQVFPLKTNKDVFGTADLIACSLGGTLHVVDLKTGVVPVDAFDNKQLAFYALGALNDSRIKKLQPGRLEMHILQSRALSGAHIKVWEIDDVEEFQREWTIELEEAIKNCEMYPDTLVQGKHCIKCNGRPMCPLQHQQAEALYEDQKTTDIELDVTVEDLGRVLPKLEQLDAFSKALKAHAKRLIERGIDVPGYKLVAKRAQRKWEDGFDAPTVSIKKVESPAQVQKRVDKRVWDTIYSKKVVKRSSGTKLVPDSEDGDAWQPGDDVLGLLEDS